MKKPDKAENEEARIEALHSLELLDTPPEERFDRLTRTAKRLFDVPIALVSLVDDERQWFKSRVGLDARETPRDVSFCGHAIHHDEAFVIPDAEQDPRFRDNPLVVEEPHVRFYAGHPLRAPGGEKLGTLCLIDHRPRSFDAGAEAALADLAGIAEREIAASQLAIMDELTGLLGRRGFRLLAERRLRLCERRGLAATLVFLDLDDFKPVNDTFGHAEGDRLLRLFADQMQESFRDSDVIARMGGDEFAVLLTDASSAYAQEAVARLEQEVRERHDETDHGYPIRFSHGIVEFDRHRHSSVDTLLEEADARMYEAESARR